MPRQKRIRAHANPMAVSDIDPPISPEEVNWAAHYPAFFSERGTEEKKDHPEVTMVDIGCGFGGLMTTLSPIFPDKLIVGIEIRDRVVEVVEETITKLRHDHAKDATALTEGRPTPYNNISVIRSNIMKYSPNYFRKGQLEKMFILFADPHFKRSKYRMRVINPSYLDSYAYLLKVGGILYTITDVSDLHLWQKQHLDEHPLFERIPDEDLKDDPCFEAIHTGTQEGQKVTRNHGDKWPAVYRRIEYKPSNSSGNQGNDSSSTAIRKPRLHIFDDTDD